MEPGTEIGSKYRVEKRLASELTRPAYSGVAIDSGDLVTLFVLTAEEASPLKAAVGLRHAHLAGVLELVARPDGNCVLVTERVVAATLDQYVADRGGITPVDAVSSVLRVADALATLHHAGAAHGLLRPASVLCGAKEHPSPLVTFWPPPDRSSPYRSPERGSGGAPSPADDTWALAGLLYELLVGEAPPTTGLQSTEDLAETGLKDEALQAVLTRGLATATRNRAGDVSELKRELARWYVDHAGEEKPDEVEPPSHRQPPPLPSGTANLAGSPVPSAVDHPPQRAPAAEPARSRWWLWVAAVAVPLGVGASWGAASLFSKNEVV